MTQRGQRSQFHWSEVRNPESPEDSTWEVWVPPAAVETVQKYGHESKFFGLLAVNWVLRNPLAIFKGWNRDRTEECFVYVGWPPTKRRNANVELPSDKTQLFLVYVLPGGSVEDWEWRKRSQTDNGKPEGVDGEIWRAF